MFPPLLIQGLHSADLPAGCWRAIIHVPRTVLYTLTHLILEITVSGRKVEETRMAVTLYQMTQLVEPGIELRQDGAQGVTSNQQTYHVPEGIW